MYLIKRLLQKSLDSLSKQMWIEKLNKHVSDLSTIRYTDLQKY